MVQAAPGQYSAGITQPPRWTLQQEDVAREFMEAYGIERQQISFDVDSPDPIFDFDALNLLVHTLGNFPVISTDLDKVEEKTGLVTATCDITVPDNRMRHVTAASFIGETLPGGSIVGNYTQALNVAQARALRKGLRAVGFDVVRAHRQSSEAPLTLNMVSETDSRTKDLAQAHILGKEMGLIQGGDKTLWSRLISIWFGGRASSAELSDEELVIFVARLRGLKSSHPQATASALERNAQAAPAS
ncbi:MAG: hypothetical protein ICV60_05650 [Pyrinomonadaceae bacterium]|nr:hypothetical protein [Pyrinomonadaceae bacterium]